MVAEHMRQSPGRYRLGRVGHGASSVTSGVSNPSSKDEATFRFEEDEATIRTSSPLGASKVHLESAYGVCLVRRRPCLGMVGSYLCEVVRAVETDKRQIRPQQLQPAVVAVERCIVVQVHGDDPSRDKGSAHGKVQLEGDLTVPNPNEVDSLWYRVSEVVLVDPSHCPIKTLLLEKSWLEVVPCVLQGVQMPFSDSPQDVILEYLRVGVVKVQEDSDDKQ